MVKSNVASGGSYNYAASQGIPSILIERGGMGDWTLAAAADSAQQGKRGGDRLENTQCPGAGCQGDDGNI